VRPTFFFGVPRIFEKIQEKMQEIGKSASGYRKAIASWYESKDLKESFS